MSISKEFLDALYRVESLTKLGNPCFRFTSYRIVLSDSFDARVFVNVKKVDASAIEST